MNSQFTDKHLASLASIMLLAPAVNFMMKEKDMDIKPEEEGFVRSYIHYGYDILIVLGLALIDWSIYALFFPLTVLYWVNYSLLGIVLLMIVIGIFAILNNKTILQMNTSASGERATVKDLGIIAYFMPLYNYYLFYNETLDNHNYRWVKESVLWRSLYLIIISIRPNVSIIFLGLFLIIARAIMIILGMDIISLNTKNAMNKWFYKNIEEFIAYPLGLVTNALKKLFQKTSTLAGEIESRKLTYSHLDPISHRRTIAQYIIAAAAIGYRGYTTWILSNPTVGIHLALLPQIMWVGKILMTIPSGKLPRIPILYTLLGGKKHTQQT